MKKKFIVTILVCTLVISALSGCGNSSQETVETVTQSEETTVETDIEAVETDAEIAETDTETTDTETADVLEVVTDDESTQEDLPDDDEQKEIEEFTVEDGMHKVAELFNARNAIYTTDDPNIINLLVTAEDFSYGYENYPMNVTTSDGVSIDAVGAPDEEKNKIMLLRFATVANFYYSYVNEKPEYYDLYDYVQSHNYSEIVNEEYWKDGADTNNLCMSNVSLAISYLFDNIDDLTPGEIISGDDCTTEIFGFEVAYEIPLLVNGEPTGAVSVFDKDGNLLNIVTYDDEEWNEEKYYSHSLEMFK